MNKEQEKIRKKSPVNIRNKKASFEYFFIEEYTAGIVLTGTEIKSIRLGKASLVDTFCYINNGEIWVKGMSISPYFYGSYNNHEMKRDRKLLLTKKEIQKLQSATKQEELEKMQNQEREKLEELSGLSAEEAKNRLVESLKDEARTDAGPDGIPHGGLGRRLI